MHDTLSSLVERALTGSPRPLEFYLRDQSRLPGPRPNLELASDVSYLLAAAVPRRPENVRALVDYFANGDHRMVEANTPAEFVMYCGVIASGACAAVQPEWRSEALELLCHYAGSSHWRLREGVAIAYRHLLIAQPQEMNSYLINMASHGSYLQQRAAIAAVAETSVLCTADIFALALTLQRIALEHLRDAPLADRKTEDFKMLRRTLGYTLSIVTAAGPEEGFALMRETASWGDADVAWVLRENLRKKRLAKFAKDTAVVSRLLA